MGVGYNTRGLVSMGNMWRVCSGGVVCFMCGDTCTFVMMGIYFIDPKCFCIGCDD